MNHGDRGHPFTFLIIIVVVSMVGCLYFGRDYYERYCHQKDAADWEPTVARVIDAHVTEVKHGKVSEFLAVVSCSYSVDGRGLQGARFSAVEQFATFAWPKDAASFLTKYPVSGSVEIYVNPRDPRECVLSRVPQKDYLGRLIGVSVGFGIGVLVCAISWRQRFDYD